MKLFGCAGCSSVLFFENDRCRRCDAVLGYDPHSAELLAVQSAGGDGAPSEAIWQPVAGEQAARRFRFCKNATDHQACNWLVNAGDPLPFCLSCRLNEVIPNLADATVRRQWYGLEIAKRRLLYTLYALALPVESKAEQQQGGLAFRFLQDTPQEKVVTGHADGVITLNVAEADSAFRENTRERLGEAYRTVLGHFRHEIGHYYWDRLISDSSWLEPFRDRFGDERAGYQEAIDLHYSQGPPADWQQSFVSAYATMHPWEDWAETWAHYLHMVDTLETAASYGLTVRNPGACDPGAAEANAVSRAIDFTDFDSVIQAWYPVTLALNSLSRSMGKDDLYPFALTPDSEKKLAFVHQVVHGEERS